jgi:hypothetical protein
MSRELTTILGGIGGLIFLYLILKNAQPFGQITQSIASSSTGLISTLQGQGGTTSFSSPV